MKSKFAFGLIAAMVVLTFAPSSFAQVNITIFNVPAAQEIATNRTAETSDTASAGAGITVSGALIADSNLSSTNLILTLPGNIMSDFNGSNPYGTPSNSSPQPSGDPLRIEAATGVFANATIVTRNGGVLTIALIPTGGIVGNNQSGSFSILGLRMNATGLTAPIAASASLNNSARGFFLATSSVPLITALGPGIGSITQSAVSGQTDQGRIQIFTNRNIVNDKGNLVVTEGFAGAWRSEAQNEIDVTPSNVGPMLMRLTVNGIPAGITIATSVAFPASQTSLSFLLPTAGNLSSVDTAADTNKQTFTITGTSLTTIESFQISFDVDQTTAPSTPPTGDITATLTMAPTSTSNTPGAVPRFTAAEVGPATIGSIVAANTTLLLPYSLREGAFDTGIQIANTTLDPFGPAGGGASPSNGSIIFDFFPRNPAGGVFTPFSLNTASPAAAFGGLSADGTLAAGGNFVALLSEILARPGFTPSAPPANFSGYIFVRTNFLDAHGTATISDFRTFSLAANVLVLRPPSSSPRNSPVGGAEQLTF